jgi:hypothetical protein
MNPAALPVLESVDTKWDRISVGKGAAEYLLPARTRLRSALTGVPRVQTLVVALLLMAIG